MTSILRVKREKQTKTPCPSCSTSTTQVTANESLAGESSCSTSEPTRPETDAIYAMAEKQIPTARRTRGENSHYDELYKNPPAVDERSNLESIPTRQIDVSAIVSQSDYLSGQLSPATRDTLVSYLASLFKEEIVNSLDLFDSNDPFVRECAYDAITLPVERDIAYLRPTARHDRIAPNGNLQADGSLQPVPQTE